VSQIPNKAAQKSKLKFILILIAVLVSAISTFMLWPASVSREEAREIALVYVGGDRANRASRDFEAFRRIWSVKVFYDGFVHEVYVSMRTGEIVRVEIDRLD